MFLKYSDQSVNYIEYDGINFEIVRRNVRYFRVEFRGEIPRMILPPGGNLNKILRENIGRIRKKYDGYMELVSKAQDLKSSVRDLTSFREIVHKYSEQFSKELRIKVKIIKFRKMIRMWGNCRSNGVITLNSRLAKLPENIISYIIYHEILHLNEKGGHTIRFKKRMKEKFHDQKKIEGELKSWFIKFDIEDVN